jgi:hypothetical protein
MDAVINGLNIAYKSMNGDRGGAGDGGRDSHYHVAVFAGLAVILALYGGYFGGLIANSSAWEIFGRFWFAIQIAFPPLFMLIAFAIVYRVAPNARDQGWHALMPDRLWRLLFMAAHRRFRMYLTYFDSYNKTYGSLGAVIVLMMWLYLSRVAVLVGGEVNSEIRKSRCRRGRARSARTDRSARGNQRRRGMLKESSVSCWKCFARKTICPRVRVVPDLSADGLHHRMRFPADVTVRDRSSSLKGSSASKTYFHPRSHNSISAARSVGGSSNSESRLRSGFSPSVVRKSVQRDRMLPVMCLTISAIEFDSGSS